MISDTLLRWSTAATLPDVPCQVYRSDAGGPALVDLVYLDGDPLFRRPDQPALVPWGDAYWSHPPSPAVPEEALHEAGEPIRIWAWSDAPAPLRVLSRRAGDEDWVALVPPGMGPPTWIDRIGVYCVQETPLTDGSVVYIGAHA